MHHHWTLQVPHLPFLSVPGPCFRWGTTSSWTANTWSPQHPPPPGPKTDGPSPRVEIDGWFGPTTLSGCCSHIFNHMKTWTYHGPYITMMFVRFFPLWKSLFIITEWMDSWEWKGPKGKWHDSMLINTICIYIYIHDIYIYILYMY